MLRATIMDLLGVISVLKRNSAINLQRGDNRSLRYLGDEEIRGRQVRVKVQAMIFAVAMLFQAPTFR